MRGKDSQKPEGDITIVDLYPDLSPEQQAEVECRLSRYFALVKRIFERICEEKPELLPELERQAMLRKKGKGQK